jgi:hypothetical protein
MLKKSLSSSVLIFILLPLLLPSLGIAPQEVIIRCTQWNPIAAEWQECSPYIAPGWVQQFIIIYVKPDDVDLPITWTITRSDDPYVWTDTNDLTSLTFRELIIHDTCQPVNYEMIVTAENDYGSATNSYTVERRCEFPLYLPTVVHLPTRAAVGP